MENKYKNFLMDDTEYETNLTQKFINRKPYKKPDKRSVTAYIPGLILKLYVSKGSKVKTGDKLLLLEAMKMQNDVTSPLDGVIKEVAIKEGSNVAKGDLLILIE